jgi:P22 coat protein - gene protein 5
VNIPIPPMLKANVVSEGGSVTTQNPSLGNAQIVLSQHAESTFQIPDVTAALVGAEKGDFSLMNKYLTPAMISIAVQIEEDLLGLYATLNGITPTGTSGVSLNESTIDLSEKSLFDNLVPEAEKLNLVVSSQGYSDLRQIERFSEEKTIGSGQAISTGKVGTLKGFDVYRSQYVQKPSSTTYNLAFAKDAFALVIRRLPQPLPGTGAIAEYAELGNFGLRIVMSYAPNTLAQQFTVDVLYGVAVLRPTFGVVVQS